jgi:hypothetical protein
LARIATLVQRSHTADPGNQNPGGAAATIASFLMVNFVIHIGIFFMDRKRKRNTNRQLKPSESDIAAGPGTW